MRLFGATLIASVVLFALLVSLAILRYPGGTWFDPHAPGHDLLRNFLCDLTQPIAHNGQPNPGSSLASAAMIVLDAGLLCLWLVVPAMSAPSRLGLPLRVLGSISFAGIVAVPLTPSLRVGAVHTLAVLAGAIPGVAAGVFAVILLRSSVHRPLFRLGASVLVVAAVDVAIFVVNTLTHGPLPLLLPVLQRIALALLLVWLTATGMTLLRVSR